MTNSVLILYGVFFALIGACIGSFLNVVIWRLPFRGREVTFEGKKARMTLSWPPSHCPVCDAAIPWYLNLPVLSWLLLRGKCAQCRTAIPIRYPLVELGTGMMFLGFYLAYFVAGWQPLVSDLYADWPVYVLHVGLAAALFAASAIDVDLFIIPLSIPWFLVIVGIVASGLIGPPLTVKSYAIIPHIPWRFWWLAKPAIGGGLGLVLANILLKLKVMPRSFDEPGESAVHEGDAAPTKEDEEREKEEPMTPLPKLTRYGVAAGAVLVLVIVGAGAWEFASPQVASLVGLCAGILVFLIGVFPRDAGQVDVTEEVLEEINGPNVRSEASKELLFLGLPVVCAVLAYVIPVEVPQQLWISRVLGSVLGVLLGGGVLWAVRVGGTLALGKEAMGMGDAHLMAGVGAVIGAPLAIVAFFLSPFLALLWVIVLKAMKRPNVLQFGPWLSVASILALLIGWPVVRLIMGW